MGTKKYPKVKLRTSSSFDFDLTILLKLTRNTAKPSHKPSFPLVNLHIHKYAKNFTTFHRCSFMAPKAAERRPCGAGTFPRGPKPNSYGVIPNCLAPQNSPLCCRTLCFSLAPSLRHPVMGKGD